MSIVSEIGLLTGFLLFAFAAYESGSLSCLLGVQTFACRNAQYFRYFVAGFYLLIISILAMGVSLVLSYRKTLNPKGETSN